MELRLRMSDKARAYIEQIVNEMLVRFPIDRDEAVGRVNQAWDHIDYFGDDDLIFHELPEEWAGDIYYGKGSLWWLGGKDLKPLPYEPEE